MHSIKLIFFIRAAILLLIESSESLKIIEAPSDSDSTLDTMLTCLCIAETKDNHIETCVNQEKKGIKSPQWILAELSYRLEHCPDEVLTNNSQKFLDGEELEFANFDLSSQMSLSETGFDDDLNIEEDETIEPATSA